LTTISSTWLKSMPQYSLILGSGTSSLSSSGYWPVASSRVPNFFLSSSATSQSS